MSTKPRRRPRPHRRSEPGTDTWKPLAASWRFAMAPAAGLRSWTRLSGRPGRTQATGWRAQWYEPDGTRCAVRASDGAALGGQLAPCSPGCASTPTTPSTPAPNSWPGPASGSAPRRARMVPIPPGDPGTAVPPVCPADIAQRSAMTYWCPTCRPASTARPPPARAAAPPSASTPSPRQGSAASPTPPCRQAPLASWDAPTTLPGASALPSGDPKVSSTEIPGQTGRCPGSRHGRTPPRPWWRSHAVRHRLLRAAPRRLLA